MKNGTIAGITVVAVVGLAAYYFYPKTPANPDENQMSSIEIYPSSTISVGGSRRKRRGLNKNKKQNKKSKRH